MSLVEPRMLSILILKVVFGFHVVICHLFGYQLRFSIPPASTYRRVISVSLAFPEEADYSLRLKNKALELFRSGAVLGTALLPNLTLNMGNNTINSTTKFQVPYLTLIQSLGFNSHYAIRQANQSPQGIQTLNDFVGKKGVAFDSRRIS